HRAFLVIKWAGALYLIFLGLKTFLRKEGPLAAQAPGDAQAGGGWRLMMRGVVLQASNPKSLMFFTALLPQFIDPGQPVGLQVAILAVSSVAVEFCVLAGYGVFAGKAAGLARQPRYALLTNRVAGACLMAAGAGIALAGRE